jgi:ribulose-phosphate 3-epimerase
MNPKLIVLDMAGTTVNDSGLVQQAAIDSMKALTGAEIDIKAANNVMGIPKKIAFEQLCSLSKVAADVDLIAVQYAELGCASVTIHAEATENIPQTLKNIRAAGSRSSLGIKPNTQIEQYADCIDLVDMFLIMTVEPGFGGQKFMENVMDKVRKTRTMIGDRPIWLQVDGGISMQTIEMALEAGADTFVVGSAVFNAPDPAQMVIDIRKFATRD